jgi:hypothetical protein
VNCFAAAMLFRLKTKESSITCTDSVISTEHES